MTALNTPLHEELLALVAQTVCSRPLGAFAQESRLDGESLRDAVQRYEVDYAWHVLGSDRLHRETIALLERKLTHTASDAQKASVAQVLQAAGARQAADALMSFDNDVPEQLAALLYARHVRDAAPALDAVS